MNRKSMTIIESLFKSNEFNDIFNHIKQKDLIDDLRMEVIVIICNLSDSKILNLFNNNTLFHYTKKTAHYSISKTGMMLKKYYPSKISNDPYYYDAEYLLSIKERSLKEENEDKIMRLIDEMDLLESGLIKAYFKLGTYRAVSKQTGISLKTVFEYINRGAKTLRRFQVYCN